MNLRTRLTLLLSVPEYFAQARGLYSIDASATPAKPQTEHLKPGGWGSKGQFLNVSSHYLKLGKKAPDTYHCGVLLLPVSATILGEVVKENHQINTAKLVPGYKITIQF